MNEKERAVTALFEIFCLSQKYMLGNFGEKEKSLTKTQVHILLAVRSRDNMSMSQVAYAISASKEQATRAVAPLVDRGYLRRHQDEHNRRIVHVELTKEGAALLRELRRNLSSNLMRRLELLDEEESVRFWKAAEEMLELLLKVDGPVN